MLLMPLKRPKFNRQKMKKLQFASAVIVFVSKHTSLSSYQPLIQSFFYPLITAPRPVSQRICLLLVRNIHYTTYISICANAIPLSLSSSLATPPHLFLSLSLSTLRLGGCVCGTQQLQKAPSSLFVDKRDGAPVSAESLDED